MEPNRISRYLVAGCLLALCGCAMPEFLKFSKEDFPKAGPKNPVTQVLTLWQPASGPGLDKRTGRGFSGQVLFFTSKEAAPAKVDGTVRIYVYDDQGTADEQTKPLHQFDYIPEAWSVHAHMGKLGLTYSTFIPYTREGSHEAHCSIRLKYTPREGPVIFSEMVNVTLPGRKKTDHGEGDVVDESDDDEASPESDVRTDVPSPLAKRNRRSDIQQVVAEATTSTQRKSPKSAIPVTDAERERIIREARARLLGATDDASESLAATRVKSRKGAGRHLLNDDEPDVDDNSDDEEPTFFRRTEKAVPQQHVLSEADEDDDGKKETIRGSRPPQGVKKEKSSIRIKRHLLEDEEPKNHRSDRTRRDIYDSAFRDPLTTRNYFAFRRRNCYIWPTWPFSITARRGDMVQKPILKPICPSTLVVVYVALVGVSSVSAQANSIFGANGAANGANGFGSGRSTAGITTGIGTAFGSGGASSATARAAGMGNTLGGMTANGGGLAQGTAGAGQQRPGMVGTNAGNNTPFLGAMQPTGQQTGRNQQGMNNRGGQNGNRGSRGNRGGQQNLNNQGNGAGNANNNRTVRPQLRVAFDYKRPTAVNAEKAIAIRFDKISKRASFREMQIDVNSGKVTLSGEVDSEENRKLAGMLAALEPGVRSVQNDLTVKPSDPAVPEE
jgi:osmotically-inducible protein OsmY